MKKYLYFIVSFFIAAGTMCFMETSYANSFDLAYEVCEKLDFEDLSKLSVVTGSFDVQNGIFRADGNVLKVTDAKYSFLNKPLAGVFNLKFDLFVSDIENLCSISVNSNAIEFADSDDKIFAVADESVIAELEYGLWYEAEFAFDALNGLKLSLLKDDRIICEKSFAVSESFAFSDISFVSDGGMYIDNLELSRPVISTGPAPVIYKSGSFIVAEAKPLVHNSMENMLVLSAYDENDNLIIVFCL